jgi:hypothetical protein
MESRDATGRSTDKASSPALRDITTGKMPVLRGTSVGQAFPPTSMSNAKAANCNRMERELLSQTEGHKPVQKPGFLKNPVSSLIFTAEPAH